MLGVGSGEALNEHITGDRWPSPPERRRRLKDAVEAIRGLRTGDTISYRGEGFEVIEARFMLPAQPPPLLIAASGQASATLAGAVGDGLIGTSPDPEVIQAFRDAGGEGKPRYGQVTVCWAGDEQEARETARAWWPNAAVEGELSAELPLPRHFEQAAAMVTEDAVADAVICGPDPERYLERIRAYAEAGYSHVYLHQVGPNQAGFRSFYQRTLRPALSGTAWASG